MTLDTVIVNPGRHGNVIASHIALVDGAHAHGTVTEQSSHATPQPHVHQQTRTA